MLQVNIYRSALIRTKLPCPKKFLVTRLKMALSIRDYKTVKAAQVTHNQGDVGYGASKDIQCSCMSLVSLSWTFLNLLLYGVNLT